MRAALLLACVLSTLVAMSQDDTLLTIPQHIQEANGKTRSLVIDLSNPDDAELALKKIHTFRYLEQLTIEGEAEDKSLRKLFYRIATLKNLASLTLKDNELQAMPENICLLRNIRSLTLAGNTQLDFEKLFNDIKGLQLTSLSLIDNDLKSVPSSISGMKSLKRVQLSGSLQMDYSEFVDRLSALPDLTTLAIPLNYITELPKNIDRLQSLQVLDVSNNSLSELPSQLSSLKMINKLSVQGNLLVDPVKDLGRLKGNNIKYLALDKELSGDELEKIKATFPEAQIDFPLSPDAVAPDSVEKAPSPVFSGEVHAKREVRALSGAYLSYPSLFRGMTYNFDTLTFEQRFNDLRYANVYQRVDDPRRARTGSMHLRTYRYDHERVPSRRDTWFSFPTRDRFFPVNYPESRAFAGMFWIYHGPLSKKQFHRRFTEVRRTRRFWFPRITPREWNDFRLDYDKNNSLFLFTLKSDTGYCTFTAYPVMVGMPLETVMQSYQRRLLQYKRTLQRRADRFNRQNGKSRRQYDAAYKAADDFAWKMLMQLMSDEEKLMPRNQWLEYYDNLVAHEQAALDRSRLSMPFVARSFAIRGYSYTKVGNGNSVPANNAVADYGNRSVNLDFIHKTGGGKLAVKSVLYIDKKGKSVTEQNGTFGLAPVAMNVHQFSSCAMVVELRSGDFGVVTADEIDRQNMEPTGTYELRTMVFDRNLNTIGELLQAAIK